jgi:hypothetical protein
MENKRTYKQIGPTIIATVPLFGPARFTNGRPAQRAQVYHTRVLRPVTGVDLQLRHDGEPAARALYAVFSRHPSDPAEADPVMTPRPASVIFYRRLV